MKLTKPSVSYRAGFLKDLKNAREAVVYLNTVLEEGEPADFLVALKNVAEAKGGMAKIARLSGINRVSLYKILSKRGNPEINSLSRLLKALGLKILIANNKEIDYKKAA